MPPVWDRMQEDMQLAGLATRTQEAYLSAGLSSSMVLRHLPCLAPIAVSLQAMLLGCVSTLARSLRESQALVYIAAFAPEPGEAVATFLEQYPSLLGSGTVADSAGFLFVDREKFRQIFAADVEPKEARVMAATQKPIFGAIFQQAPEAAAWKNIPCFYLLTTQDHAINPDLERLYAKRIGATTVEIASSQAVFVAHPHAVVKLIEQVANAVS